MENLLCNRLPVPIANIKDFDDCIIEGINTTITNAEIVNDWDSKNRKKITNKLSVCQNEKIFEDVLNDYIRVLKEQALNFKEKAVLKTRILRHIKVFYMYYSTNDGICADMCNYLDQMEKILIVLCNLELEVVRHVKRKEKEYSRKIKEVAQSFINILSVFMLHRERSILHILLKLDTKRDTPSWKDVMHIVYRYYLITLPVDDRSDECFCRNYLLFQRWKSITDERKHMGMDKIMYFRFNRSPESIARSRTLRTILSPSAESIVDVVDVLTDGRQTAVDAYFKHIEQKDKEDDMCLPPSINLDSDEEEEDRTQTLQFVPGEKGKRRRNGLIKAEKAAKESVNYIEVPASNGQVVCIIDDDSDIEEVSVPVSNRSRQKTKQMSAPPQPVVSFLDSISIPDDSPSSPPTASPPATRAEEPVSTALPEPAENSSLLTTYLNHMRDQGSVMEAHHSPVDMELESLSIAAPAELSSGSVQTDCVDGGKSASPDVPLNNSQVENCTACLSLNSGASETTSLVKPNLRTVEIQTDHVERFTFTSGLISPPVSDRVVDEASPETMDNICAAIQSNNLNDMLPDAPAVSESSVENSRDEPDMGANMFYEPNNNENQKLQEDSSSALLPEAASNEIPESIADAQESLTTLEEVHAEPVSEIEVSEVTLPPLQTCEEVELSEIMDDDEHQGFENEQSDSVADAEDNEAHEEFEIASSVTQIEAANETETNEEDPIAVASRLGDLSCMQVSQPINAHGGDAHDGAADGYEIPMDVIPMDVLVDDYPVIADNEISNVILNSEKGAKSDYQPYVTDGDIMLVHNVNKGDGMYNKFSVFKKVSDVDEAVISTLHNDQLNDTNKKASLLTDAGIKRLVDTLPVGEAKKVGFADSYKIQASIQMNHLVNKSSLKKDKLNGENNKTVHVGEKIIFTSTERVSAPLSLFAQFEQSQSDLVEKTLSGPIEPINSTASINSDNSNSNDSFYLFEPNKSSSTRDHVRNSLLDSPEGSLISPPYEDIHAQEFEKHILTVNSGELVSKSKHAIEKEMAMDENRDNKMLERRENRLNNTSSTDVLNKSIVSTNKRRRKEDGGSPNKRPRVNFGPTEVRIIPRERQRLLSDDTIELARESMEEYKVGMNNKQLLYLQPQVGVERDSPKELALKERQMRLQHAIHALLTSKKYNFEKTCIVTRIDYKKSVDDSASANATTKLPENSNGSNSLHSVGLSVLNSRSKGIDTPSASSFPPPTSCAPPTVTLFNSARELEDPSFVGKVQEAPSNSSQHVDKSPQNFCNDKFNELLDQCNAEILNLSVSSKASAPSEVPLPESEFSRSPKFLQSPDQIVQHCLLDNILENNDPVVSVNNDITFLSNNSNFYSTSTNSFKLSETELKTLEQSQSQPQTNCVSNTNDFKSCLDDDMLKSEIDKLIDEKIKNFENETCLPLKKRRVPVINVKSQIKADEKLQAKEEISYPATPMISIAEIEALQQNGKNHSRSFKTPAERKEMPPLPVFYNLNTTDPSPIITDQFNINNHTYNNPTINYHMSNVPVPFINVPCASYYSLPPILLPFNNIHTFDSANVNQNPNPYNTDDGTASAAKVIKKEKKEKKKRSRKDKHCENYYPDYKKANSKTV